MIIEIVEQRTGEVIYLVPCLVPTKLGGSGKYSVVIDKATIGIVRELARQDDVTPEKAAAIFASYYAGETWIVRSVHEV